MELFDELLALYHITYKPNDPTTLTKNCNAYHLQT